MVVYLLNFQATLENVAEICFMLDSIEWCLDVAEPTGDGIRPRITFSSKDVVELHNSRGVANFALKWEGAMKQAYLTMMEVKNVTQNVYTAANSEAWVPIVAFDSRGLQPTACHSPNLGITVISTGGQKFEHADFSDDEWCDYDQNAEQSVGVYNIHWNFTVHRK